MSDWAQPGADAILAGGTFPTSFYIARHTGNPGSAGTANPAADTRRVGPVTYDVVDPVVDGRIANDIYAEILAATTDETITHVSLWDASTAGTCYFIDALSPSVVIETDQTVAVAIGQSVITLTQWV